MRKRMIAVSLIGLILVFTGCDDSTEDDEKIEVPFSSENAVDDMLYTDAENELIDSGFTNIKAVPIEDLITGWLTKDGEIESISIDGDTDFISGRKYDPGVEVEIQYHTFPSDTDDESKESTEEPATNDTQSATDIHSAEEASNITVDNKPEFSAVLNNNTDDDSSYIAFAEKYKDQTIEFDGHVDYIAHYKEYDTRWEALINSSDWNGPETVIPGPTFKIEDFNLQDINYDGGILDVGTNVHVVAKIIEYDEQAQLFFLDLMTITQR